MAERVWADPGQAVVQVLDGRSQVGAGCLIGDGLVLTAEHLVTGESASIVTADGPGLLQATVSWTDLGAAVLQFRREDQRAMPPVRVGAIPRGRSVPNAHVTWFPGGSRPGLEHATGFISASRDQTPGFDFEVVSEPAAPGQGEREWLAGAPVWISGWLVGIITSALPGPQPLRGVLLTDLLSDPVLAANTGLTPEPVPADLLTGATSGISLALLGRNLSESVREVIRRAATRAGDQPVDASFVLVSALQYADETQLGGITSALLDELTGRRDDRIAPHQRAGVPGSGTTAPPGRSFLCSASA
jgi:hypothetical protein